MIRRREGEPDGEGDMSGIGSTEVLAFAQRTSETGVFLSGLIGLVVVVLLLVGVLLLVRSRHG
jgi:hypothetical protein